MCSTHFELLRGQAWDSRATNRLDKSASVSFCRMSGGHAESLPPDWQVSSEQTENFMAQVAMVVVAGPHICSFVCLACCRSSHGIFCAVGSSIAVEAVLLWWFLSHPGTSVRIALQTLGLGLAGAWLFLRTLWLHASTASSSQQVGMGGSLGGGSGVIDEGRSGREGGLRIIGAEQWLLAWRFLALSRRFVHTAVAAYNLADISHDLNALPPPLSPKYSFLTPSSVSKIIVITDLFLPHPFSYIHTSALSMSSWTALLYGSPCVFALLRQGADSALATFACYLLFASLLAQTWVFVRGTLDCGTAAAQQLGGCSSSSAKGAHMMTHQTLAASVCVCVYGCMRERVYL